MTMAFHRGDVAFSWQVKAWQAFVRLNGVYSLLSMELGWLSNFLFAL